MSDVPWETAARSFLLRHGVSHVEWLARWRRDELSDTEHNNLVLSEALVLEDEPGERK